jgi:hypothetical protein
VQTGHCACMGLPHLGLNLSKFRTLGVVFHSRILICLEQVQDLDTRVPYISYLLLKVHCGVLPIADYV